MISGPEPSRHPGGVVDVVLVLDVLVVDVLVAVELLLDVELLLLDVVLVLLVEELEVVVVRVLLAVELVVLVVLVVLVDVDVLVVVFLGQGHGLAVNHGQVFAPNTIDALISWTASPTSAHVQRVGCARFTFAPRWGIGSPHRKTRAGARECEAATSSTRGSLAALAPTAPTLTSVPGRHGACAMAGRGVALGRDRAGVCCPACSPDRWTATGPNVHRTDESRRPPGRRALARDPVRSVRRELGARVVGHATSRSV